MKQASYFFSGNSDFKTDMIPVYPEELSGAIYEALSAQICWKNAVQSCGTFSFTISNDSENSTEIHTANIDSEDNSLAVLMFNLTAIAAESLQIGYSVNLPNNAEIGIVIAYKKVK